VIRFAFAALLVLHGLIHAMGFAKAFGLAELPQLTETPSRIAGLGWLLSAALFLATAVTLFVWPRGFWAIGAAALLVSQPLIFGAWRDAKFGSIASLLVLVGVVWGVVTRSARP
jgi:hypothetical protein